MAAELGGGSAGTDLSLPEISTIPSCGWPSAWI